MANNPENVRLTVLMKLQEALDEEAILEEQMLALMHRFADRFTDRKRSGDSYVLIKLSIAKYELDMLDVDLNITLTTLSQLHLGIAYVGNGSTPMDILVIKPISILNGYTHDGITHPFTCGYPWVIGLFSPIAIPNSTWSGLPLGLEKVLVFNI
uniref:Uncharacterized protein n=1 Tax=Tanacetum cinerariifolium TaxID=118510 RepID=A0A6L2KF79_TANCI|nr:hypothetical protein [Tanacetum cinerariifolium]